MATSRINVNKRTLKRLDYAFSALVLFAKSDLHLCTLRLCTYGSDVKGFLLGISHKHKRFRNSFMHSVKWLRRLKVELP